MGHRGVQNLGIPGDFDSEAILKAHLLDSQIQLQVFQLAAERNLVCVHVVQHTTQKITQAAKHLFCLASILLPHQHHDGV